MGTSVDQFLQGRTPQPQATPDGDGTATDRFLIDPEVRARLGVGANELGSTNSDIAARVLRLQSKTGLPEDLITRNLDAIEADARKADFDPGKYRASSPLVARWLAEHPKHLALASEDLTRLSWLERQWGNMKAQYREGQEAMELKTIGEAAWLGTVTPAQRKRQAEIEATQSDPQRDYGITGFFEGIPGAVANQLPIMYNTFWGKAKAAIMGGLAGGEVGMVGGAGLGAAAGAGVGGVGAIPGAATGATTGFVVGGRTGAAMGWEYGGVIEAARMEGALAYLDYEKMKDDQGRPLDRRTAQGAAAITGALNGMLEVVGFETIAKNIPGLNRLGKEGVKQLFRNRTTRKAMMDLAKGVGESMATEGSTEFLQDVVKNGAGEIATMIQDGSIKELSTPEILARIFSPEHMQEAISDAKAGAQGGGGMALAGHVAEHSIQHITDYKNIKAAENRTNFFLAIGDEMQKSPMMEKMPEKMQEVVERLTKDGPVENVYIPVSDWREYWQKQNVDPMDAAKEVGSLDSYEEAVQTGADIQIKTARWAVTIAPSEHNKFFSQLLRLAPDEMNFKEAQELREQNAAEEQKQQEAAKEVEGQTETVVSKITEQLKATGRYTDQQIAAMSQLYGDATRTLAQRTGMSPTEVLDRYGLTITAMDSPADSEGLQQRRQQMADLMKMGTEVADMQANVAEELRKLHEGNNGEPLANELSYKELQYNGEIHYLEQLRNALVKGDSDTIQQILKEAQTNEYAIYNPDFIDRLRAAMPTLFKFYTEPAPMLPGFQSKLERLISEKVQKKGTVQQAKAAISGAKAEEREWTGIDRYLDELDPNMQITQDQLMAYARTHRVHLEIRSLGESEEERAARGEISSELSDRVDEHMQRWVDMHVNVVLSQHPEWTLSRALDQVMSNTAYEAEYDRIIENLHELGMNDQPSYQYEAYSLPGGENYREVAVVMPENTYQSGHFGTEGILAHMRLKDRIGPNGERILFIEEIQSDLHQAARREITAFEPTTGQREPTGERYGYETPELAQQVQAANDEVEAVSEVLRNYLRELNTKHKSDDSTAYGENTPEEDKKVDELRQAFRQAADKRDQLEERMRLAVPNAPFKSTWQALALKAIIAEAVKNGQTMIAWTTGRDQVVRYGRDVLDQRQIDGLMKSYDEMLPKTAEKFGKPFGAKVTEIRINLITNDKDVQKLQRLQDTAPPLTEAEEKELEAMQPKAHEWIATVRGIDRQIDMLRDDLQEYSTLEYEENPSMAEVKAERDIRAKIFTLKQERDRLQGPAGIDKYFGSNDNYLRWVMLGNRQIGQLKTEAYPLDTETTPEGERVLTHKQKDGQYSVSAHTTVHAMEITPAMKRAAKREEFELYQRAFHGSPHAFDTFSLHHIGTGEGHQSYGWGLYFAGSRSLGEHYKKTLTERYGPMEMSLTDEENKAIPVEVRQKLAAAKNGDQLESLLTNRLMYLEDEIDRLRQVQDQVKLKSNFFNGPDRLRAMEEEYSALDKLYAKNESGARFKFTTKPGRMFTVEIPEIDEMMHWDKDWLDQPKHVREAFKRIFPKDDWHDMDAGEYKTDGEEMYTYIIENLMSLNTKTLADANIPADILQQVFKDMPTNVDPTTYMLQRIEERAPEIASRWLNKEGVKGIAYLNGISRGSGDFADPTKHNFVVFDDQSIDMISYHQKQPEPHRELRLRATHEMRQTAAAFEQRQEPANLETARQLRQIESAVSSRDHAKVVDLFRHGDEWIQSALQHDVRFGNLREWLSTFGINLADEAKSLEFEGEDEQRFRSQELQDAAYDDVALAIEKLYNSQGRQFLDDEAHDDTPETKKLNKLLDAIAAGDHEAAQDIAASFGGELNAAVWTDKFREWISYMGTAAARNEGLQPIDRFKELRTTVLKGIDAILTTLDPKDDEGDHDIVQQLRLAIEEGKDMDFIADLMDSMSPEVHDKIQAIDDWASFVGAYPEEDSMLQAMGSDSETRYDKIRNYALYQLEQLLKSGTFSADDQSTLNALMGALQEGDIESAEGFIADLSDPVKQAVNQLDALDAALSNDQAMFFGERLRSELDAIDTTGWKQDEIEGLGHLRDAIERGDSGFFEEVQHEFFSEEHFNIIDKLPSLGDWHAAAEEEQDNNDNEDDDENDSGDGGFRSENDRPDGGPSWGGDPDAWMKQGNDLEPKGRIRIGANEMSIELFKSADLSTFLHESGHFFLEVLDDLGAQHEELAGDRHVIRQWLGLSDDEPLTEDAHETFARGFEAYLMEGKAPTSSLRMAFARFRAWLTGIYRTIRNLNVQVTPEVKRVFDRMLATDDELAAAAQEIHAEPLFQDPEAMGMTPLAAAQYQQAVEEARQAAETELTAKIMREVTREQTALYKAQRELVRQSVVEEVNNDRDWRARALLTRGTLPDGSELPEGIQPFKLSKTAIAAQWSKDLLKALPRPYAYTASHDGVHPNIAADMLGYTSGDELLRVLSATNESPKAYIERTTDERTRAQHGEMMKDGTIQAEAMDAIHNDKRALLLQKELQHLASTNLAALKGLIRRVARPLAPLAQIRQQAEDIIDSKLVRDIRPIIYQRAEGKAATAAMEALLRGDINTAFEQKQRQLLNAELYRAASNAQDRVTRVVSYMSKFNKASTRDRLAKAGGSYLEQIDAIRSRFDFSRGISFKDLDKREALRDFVKSQHELGFTIAIPEKILNESYQQHYKETQLSELNDIFQTVQQIEHLARVKNRLLASARARTLEEATSQIIASIKATHEIKEEKPDFAPSFAKRVKTMARGVIAAHTKMEFMFEWLDGNKEQGATWEHMFKPMIDAENDEARMMHESVQKMNEIFSVYPKSERATWFFNKIHVPSIESAFTKANILAVALNQGNDYNKQALMRGYGWTEDQVNQILSHMDAKDWQIVQQVWDHLESYWPKIAKLEKELNGLEPEKVQAQEVKTQYGTLRGGYYPIVFDSKLSWRQAVLESKNSVPELFGGQWARAQTKQGHTEARTDTGGKPILLELTGLSEHIANVVHDLSHRRAVIDVNRLIQNKDVREAIQGSIGTEMYKQLLPWLRNVAGARRADYTNPIEGLLAGARHGATTVAMGWKITTGLAQFLSYTNTIKEIGPQYAMSGVKQVYAKPWEFKEQWSFVTSRSDFMKNRLESYDRDVSDILKRMNVVGQPGITSALTPYTQPVRNSFFMFVGFMDMGASLPSWLGAYKKAMDGKVAELAGGDEPAAIDYADKVVRQTQGVGAAKDLANVQTGSELYKNFTMFYSYFNVLFNQFAKVKHEYQLTKNVPRAVASLALLWFIPAAMQELVVGRGPSPDDDDETWMKWFLAQEAQYPFQTIVLLRDIINGMDKFGYEPSAAFDMFKNISATGKAVVEHAVDPDKELTRTEVKAGADAAGYILKLPSKQLWLTLEFFYDWLTGEKEPESTFDAVRGATVGTPRETQ